MSPEIKEDSDCFLTVSFHILLIRLCQVNKGYGIRTLKKPAYLPLGSFFPLHFSTRRPTDQSLLTLISTPNLYVCAGVEQHVFRALLKFRFSPLPFFIIIFFSLTLKF